MSINEKISKLFGVSTIKMPKGMRISFVILLAIIGVTIIVSCLNNGNQEDVDENVYLYEEVVFASEIFIKCIGINAIENDDVYTLNLQLRVEQVDIHGNPVHQEISPNQFRLKLVDRKAKSPMSVFIESVANATISVIASGAIGGDINVIEETVGFAADYIQGSIENSSSGEEAIPDISGKFKEFFPSDNLGKETLIDLSFELSDSFLKSTKTMVLSIDSFDRWEKNIFLILRPNTVPYIVNFDLNGGEVNEPITNVLVDVGKVVDLPENFPIKGGYQFLYWTTVLNDISTRVRDLYLAPNVSVGENSLFAFYQELIPLDEFINIRESIALKDGTYLISIDEYFIKSQVTTLNRNQEQIEKIAPDGKEFLEVHLTIDKAIEGHKHLLDNDDDFYLENDHSEIDVSTYFGYTYTKSINPIDDYTWIGVSIDEIGKYDIILIFEVDNDFNPLENIYFLEIDFFTGKNSKSILLK